MLLNQLRNAHILNNIAGINFQARLCGVQIEVRRSSIRRYEDFKRTENIENQVDASSVQTRNEMISSQRAVPILFTNKDPVILSFDDVPGPKTLKYLSSFRQYLSKVGTQVIAGVLTFGLNLRSSVSNKGSLLKFSSLFDEYGPVVRFVSPVGGDVVLINHPDHIQKVYNMEGEYPVRSALDSLEKYRTKHRNHLYGGLYTVQGQDWMHQRSVVYNPLHNSVSQHMHGIYEMCENFTQKVYNMRNNQDEVPKDIYKELHKWAFDCLGLIIFSKKFTMLDTELICNQCDMSWFYHNLVKATEAIIKCESGLHMWKLVSTPAWYSLVKHCDTLDSLIGKHVLEAERTLSFVAGENKDIGVSSSLIIAMLEDKMSTEDVVTVLMDMMLIGVNTIAASMSFLTYHLAKYQRAQKLLHQEIESVIPNFAIDNLTKLKEQTPYLQACIKETLRLAPPISLISRVLTKNVILDKYNIPRGTLIIMSISDASLKERNYIDATKFYPERWLKPEVNEYHAFASIPFGFGARKCLGQNVAETMLSLLTIKLIQKYKLEYYYGDIQPTKSFIARPDKPLKIRFIDRM